MYTADLSLIGTFLKKTNMINTHQYINVCKYQCKSIFVYSEKTLFFKRNPKDMLSAFCCFLNLCCYLKTCMPMQYQWYERIVIGWVIGNIIGTLLSIMPVRFSQAGVRKRYIQSSVIIC